MFSFFRPWDSGAVSVMFAMMLPVLILFYSVAFDGANFQSGRARLIDALNQGVLSVAVTDNRNETTENVDDNLTAINNYISYYVSEAIVKNDNLAVTVKQNYNSKNQLSSVDYIARGTIRMRSLIRDQQADFNSEDKVASFTSIVDISADSSAGIIRKGGLEERKMGTDFAFVVDFSLSMKNRASKFAPEKRRIDMLHRVINDFNKNILKDNPSGTDAIGIVPFSVGVPEVLPGENIFGGTMTTCSYGGKLLDEYNHVDMKFWYNKARIATRPVAGGDEDDDGEDDGEDEDDSEDEDNEQLEEIDEFTQAYRYDTSLYNWYKYVVAPAHGLATKTAMDDMVARGWCEKNDFKNTTEARKAGKARYYSCDADPRSRMSRHYGEFKRTRLAAHRLMYYTRTKKTLFNANTIDFDGMFKDGYIFSDKGVTRYQYHHDYVSRRPFPYDCRAAFGSITRKRAQRWLVSKDLPYHYLIELTNNPSEIDKFQDMTISNQGLTYVTSGLLRAVPLIAKGKNPRKAIIVISDGRDNIGKKLSQKLFVDYQVCDKIRDGLKVYSAGPTKEADIYFIYINSTNQKKVLQLWRDNCTKNVYFADNYKDLLDILMTISNNSQPNTHFINADELNS